MKYVSGETIVHGTCSIGTKTGLMKSRGNFANNDSIITLDGISVGGAERMIPKLAKQKQPKGIANNNINGET